MSKGAPLTVLYDACVLHPDSLRDLLVQLAGEGQFRARWSQTILAEMSRSVLERFPHIRPEQWNRTCALMNAHVLDALVVGYEPLIPFLTLPDKDDRHVLAAAIVGEASILITFNRKDFPATALQPHGIVVQHPDEFLAARLMQDPEPIYDAVRSCRARFRKPPRSVAEHLELLRRQGLDRTVELLRLHADRL